MIAYNVAQGAPSMYKSVTSPADLLRHVTTSGGKLATTTVTEAVELHDDYAIVRAYDRTQPQREAWSCGISRGLLRSLPRLLGMEPALLTESECQARGGTQCVYNLRWERRERTTARAEPTTGEIPEVAALTNRLEALQATAAELTAAQDVDRVLALITERAGVAVRAPQFVLAVRTRDDGQPQVHHLGCTEELAAEQARALLAGELDEGDGARLIVDIASARRHYGKLAAIFPTDRSFFEYERRLLAAYAGHAAAALDAATALDEARRDRDTARAMFDLAGALARVGTRVEVAERLAAAVPAATGCDRANVWLWDQASRSLQLTGRAGPPGDGTATAELHADAIPNLAELAARPRPLVVRASQATGAIRAFMDAAGTSVSGIVPICAHGQFLGVAAAGFTDPDAIDRVPDLFDRLTGLADHAATALTNADLVERIRHQALHDGLTDLPNRPLLEDRLTVSLRQAHRRGAQVSLLFIDLDRFKNVNDTLGHGAGDELIRLVSRRLAGTVRDGDTLARLGGDEFVVLLGGAGGTDAAGTVAEKILKVLRQPFFVAEHELYISGSIGIVHAPEHGTDCGTLLAHADAAMYAAKSLGRNTWETYRPARADTRREELRLESRLHTAISRDELTVLYQPQVDLRTMRVTGVEALVRWDHPELGRLGPDRFIPLAEETGVIVDIDRWVLEQACRQAREWVDTGLPPLRIAVNLSTRDVRDPGLNSIVARALDSYGIPPELLELEVTDRVVLEDDDDLVGILNGLKTLGVRLAIDDFGTGSSVLRRIERCPIDTLKIDKSFVQEITSMQSEAPVVIALISMAERLGMELVAEGVETAVQGGFLRRRGCHLAQGYFFAHPLDPPDVERLVLLTTRPAESLPA
jgi:diguanylate cyclase (GGDEF)-like protein